MIMIIVDVQGNIYLELSKLEREMGGGGGGGGGKGKFSKAHRINYDARFTDVACINPVQKTNKI